MVGVLKSKGYNSFGMDQDNLMIAPYTTVMKRVLAQNYLSSINCSALTEELTDKAIEELTTVLRSNHKISGEADNDFTIRSQEEMMQTMSSTMDTITIILVVAAAFSLLVAGIGINVNRMDFPPELQGIATSIGNECGTAPDRNCLAAEIANELEALLPQLETGEFLAESRRRSNVIGREVLVIEGGKQYPARAVDIDDRGCLVVEKGPNREKAHLASGEVSLRWLEEECPKR